MIEELDEQNKEDLIAIWKLKNYLKGNKKSHRTQGTLLNMITSRAGRRGSNGESFPTA